MSHAIAASGRMRFPLGAPPPVSVVGGIALRLADGPFAGWGNFSPAYWSLTPGSAPASGLIRAVGPAGYSRDYSGFEVDGSGDVLVRANLAFSGIFGGTAGETVPAMIVSVLRQNGVEIARTEVDVTFDTGFLKNAQGGGYVEVTAPCVAGDRFDAGVIVNQSPLIYAYSAGAGQSVFFTIDGTLTGASAEEPSFAMRGSAVTA